MRTQKEIENAIEVFKHELTIVPNYTMFGDNNHEAIEGIISFLKREETLDDIYERYSENTYSSVTDIELWLEGEGDLEDYLWNPDSIHYIADVETGRLDGSNPIHLEQLYVCPKPCGNCPFSNTSMRGFLGGYSINDFVEFHRTESSFPCHKLTKDDTNTHEAHKKIEEGRSMFCRGYVESLIKSAKSPRNNPLLMKAIEQVKASGLHDRTMSIFEFMEFHKII